MSRTLKSGFGMIEIVIYVAILAVLATIAIPSYLSYMKTAAKATTEGNLNLLKNEINRYHGDMGRYPRALDDLVDKPDTDEPSAKRWNGPYVDVKGGGLPQDGWKNDFVYELTPGGAHPYDLYSYGPDGEDGSDDSRISVW